LDQSDGALIGLEQVPAAVDDNRRKWLLLSQHKVERIPHSGKLRRGELGFMPNRSEARSYQQLIVLAQGYIERRREPSNHIATGGGASDLQKTQMALRDAGPAGKLELRPSPASTPRAQAGGKLRFGSHDYLSGSCTDDL
jgi:hypothetical protein